MCQGFMILFLGPRSLFPGDVADVVLNNPDQWVAFTTVDLVQTPANTPAWWNQPQIMGTTSSDRPEISSICPETGSSQLFPWSRTKKIWNCFPIYIPIYVCDISKHNNKYFNISCTSYMLQLRYWFSHHVHRCLGDWNYNSTSTLEQNHLFEGNLTCFRGPTM